ncbi:MAG: DUF819 family protein [Saprospiraceae bacterium]|nr:DUF819 family protein [Saprospiraceae bacterium]
MIDYLLPFAIVAFAVMVIIRVSASEHIKVQLLLDWVPAILLAYIIPAIICGVMDYDFNKHIIHQLSKDLLIPFTILVVMSSMTLLELKKVGWKPVVVFVSGSFFIAVFPIILFATGHFIPSLHEWLLTGDQWKGLITVIGSWIGGSISQLVLKEAVNCPENVFLTILIFDNLLVNVWTIYMFQFIKRSDKINKRLGIYEADIPDAISESHVSPIPRLWMILILISITVTNYYLNLSFIFQIISLSILGLYIGNAWPRWNRKFALQISSVLILIIMSILGLKLKFENLRLDYVLLSILGLWISGHFIFTILVAFWLKVNMAWVAVGSMANVGGIATAPAVTASYDKRWMPHAIILAVLSMATGTFWGLCTIWIIQQFIT